MPERADLSRYPRPNLAVDVALLTVTLAPRPQLGVVLVRPHADADGGGWRLPGGFVHERQTLGETVARVLTDKVGLAARTRQPEQLHVFDDPQRDGHRGWVVSVAHRDTVRADELAGRSEPAVPHDVAVVAITDGAHALDDDGGLVVDLPGGQAALPYDHLAVLRFAVEDLRARYRDDPDPGHFLDDTFTLRELRRVHEAVAGGPLLPDTFRRHVGHGLEPTGEEEGGRVGRPAAIFRRLESGQSGPRETRRPARSNAVRLAVRDPRA